MKNLFKKIIIIDKIQKKISVIHQIKLKSFALDKHEEQNRFKLFFILFRSFFFFNTIDLSYILVPVKVHFKFETKMQLIKKKSSKSRKERQRV